MAVNGAYHEVRAAGHGPVHRAVGQRGTVHVVGGVGAHGAHHVGRVHELERGPDGGVALEVPLDAAREPDAHLQGTEQQGEEKQKSGGGR